jgi:PAS domain S-box-containing protein
MTVAYAYTPAIWPPLAGALFMAILSLYSWRHRGVPGARPLAISYLFGFLWLMGTAGQVAAADLQSKSAWYAFQALWVLPAATAGACFAFEYVYPGRWLTRRNLILLAIPPLLVALLIVTNQIHHTLSLTLIMDGSRHAEPGAAGWVFIGYSMALAAFQVAAYAWLFVRSPQHRWPAALMTFVVVVARVQYLLVLVGQLPIATPNTIVILNLLPAAVYAIVLFGFRIFDPLPAARKIVMEQMLAGVVVFDANWRVVIVNPAAETILGIRAAPARGKTWQQLAVAQRAPAAEFLSSFSSSTSDRAGVETTLPELACGVGMRARQYAPTLSQLEDFRGHVVGHLLILRDVTEQRRAQAQILEHQRSLAMLQERERLARELHDSIGQVLGYASFQVDAAGELIDAGQEARARAQLDRLAMVLRDAHADVRQHILDLRAAPSTQQPFFAAVRRYLDGFTRNYDLPTALTVGEELNEDTFPLEVQQQLYRILQEALGNTRKHARAHRVQVAFEAESGTLRMNIADDGCGFDLDLLAVGARATIPVEGHFGLDSMRQRAAEIGGNLRIETAPGAGTRVVVEVPREEG